MSNLHKEFAKGVGKTILRPPFTYPPRPKDEVFFMGYYHHKHHAKKKKKRK